MRHFARRLCGRLFKCCRRRRREEVGLPTSGNRMPNREIDSLYFDRLFPIVDFLIRRVLGRILYIKVYCILAFVLFVTITVVIPYESLHKPLWAMLPLTVFAVYISINLIFHFNKACSVKPGSPPKSDLSPRCYTCDNHKPLNAHHCSICNVCVMNMDHHCIWLNQCVGARNHRYFLQFIGFVALGCGTFVLAAFNTFYYNYWRAFTHNRMFCDSNTLADRLPWFELVCGRGPSVLVSAIFAAYLLCLIVSLMIGGFFYWNFVLISYGETYLGVIISGTSIKQILLMVFFPYRSAQFGENWRRFLGLDTAGRTFIRHILLPSSHDASSFFEWDGNGCGQIEQKEPLLIV